MYSDILGFLSDHPTWVGTKAELEAAVRDWVIEELVAANELWVTRDSQGRFTGYSAAPPGEQ